MSGTDENRPAGESPRAEARQALDLLYREHVPKLRRKLHARMGSPDEANDLIQDAFARLLGSQSLGRLQEPAAFLNRIVRNLLIDRSRRSSARPGHVPYTADMEVVVRPEQADAIEVEQMRDRYRQVVTDLPERTRAVFLLHRCEGLRYKEIAKRLDISVRTVEWHVAQAIVRIGRGLDRE